MYDPFAAPNQPPPGTMVAQHNQVMPNPVPVSTNNALAALYNKHMMNIAGPNGTPPNGQFPLNHGAGGPIHGQQGPGDWRDAFQQARMDWRSDRPMPGAPDWRTQLGDWRDQRPMRQAYRMGTVPTTGY